MAQTMEKCKEKEPEMDEKERGCGVLEAVCQARTETMMTRIESLEKAYDVKAVSKASGISIAALGISIVTLLFVVIAWVGRG